MPLSSHTGQEMEDQVADVPKLQCPCCLNSAFPSSLSQPPACKHSNSMSGHHISCVERTKDAGCSVCSLLYRGLLAIGATDVIEKDQQVFIHASQEEDESFHLWFPIEPVGLDVRFQARCEVEISCRLKTGPTFDADFMSEQCIQTIRKWLHKCEMEHSHEMCRSPTKTTLPCRVLDVGLKMLPTVKLVETNGLIQAKYIALSHCWGTTKPFITTTSNLEEHKVGIDIACLPKTFRDAIYIARELGVQYVWIDSLCILQDSEHDWDVESARMCDVYEKAYVTIAASTAVSDEEGILIRRPNAFCGIPISSLEGSDRLDVIVRQRGVHRSGYGKMRTDHGPLGTRGWTFQEVILPRRFLSYTSEELVYKCSSVLTCECEHLFMEDGNLELPTINPDTSIHDLYDFWKKIVTRYSGRKLTYELDKLAAISGIANKIQLCTKDTYLAGLWKSDLLAGLLWFTIPVNYGSFPTHPTVYRAPSFAWPSVEGEVMFSVPLSQKIFRATLVNPEYTASILNAVCTPKGLNATGLVTDGYVRISARCRGALMRQSYSKNGACGARYEISWDLGQRWSILGRSCTGNYVKGMSLNDGFAPDAPLREVQICAEGQKPLNCLQRVESGSNFIPAEGEVLCAAITPYVRMGHSLGLYILVLGLRSRHPDTYQRLGLLAFDLGDGPSINIQRGFRGRVAFTGEVKDITIY